MKGRIHSFESMGLVDGPGIRSVVFFQGCNLRCKFCHNPDTWTLDGGTETEVSELVAKLSRFKTYYDKSGGGVTCSGGEPLLQPLFLIELFKGCKEIGINTCLDTSGVGVGNYEEILKYTDLVLLDIKHYEKGGYKEITRRELDEFNVFLEALNKTDVKVWIRQVIVPGFNDSEEYMKGLADYVKNNVKNFTKLEVLPYHVLGVSKYEGLNIPYPLEGVEPMNKEDAKIYSDFFYKYY
ncbi:pyruvate formate lyase-activating protein [Clostridium bornimense]|uniref:pyruvate formate-lyase-activating protein n=1 Tax=Clostridium bornimense TaxID=1216932 RepID=UPI001C125ED6|nr:pyruvate formate-lyase-activating protein [Clostridium bornimense]MBU5315091.1 pyruvate formate lyase-activating protein [Clostridium bornimense]